MLSVSTPSFAQIFDDDDFLDTSSEETASVDEDEAFFNELFEEFPEDERDVTLPATFDDAISEAAKIVKSYSEHLKKDSSTADVSVEKIIPLDGDIYLNIVNGSFKIFKNLAGKIRCRFSVRLKSDIDREIDIIALSLSYPKRSFAFIFRDATPKGELIETITTGGDICYDLSGAPDININKCRIKNTSNQDCAAHIKWDDRAK